MTLRAPTLIVGPLTPTEIERTIEAWTRPGLTVWAEGDHIHMQGPPDVIRAARRCVTRQMRARGRLAPAAVGDA